jgi:UDP-glucuronate decarboxylase
MEVLYIATGAASNVLSGQRRILVTGGVGFLGAHLCRHLLDKGHEVLCAANFSTITRRNIDDLLGDKRFELLRHNVNFPLFVEVDEISSPACPALSVQYHWDPVPTTKTSVSGTINMPGLADRGVKLEHQTAINIEPENLAFGLSRWVRLD